MKSRPVMSADNCAIHSASISEAAGQEMRGTIEAFWRLARPRGSRQSAAYC